MDKGERLKQIEFKRAVNGFNRAQVTAYIAELSKQSCEVENKLKAELESLREQNEELRVKIEKERSQKDERIEEVERELVYLKNRVDELKDKETKYDSTVGHIGAAMLAAKSTADSLLIEAKRKASIVSCELTNAAANVYSEILGIRRELEGVSSVAEEALYHFNLRIQKASELLEQVGEKMRSVKPIVEETNVAKDDGERETKQGC